jgi:uncharacterized protein YukE
MPDMTALLAGLEDYHESLVRHIDQVRQDFIRVENAWACLDECFAGQAADEFRAVWEAASQRFREYVDRTADIQTILSHRIESLREADRPFPSLDG